MQKNILYIDYGCMNAFLFYFIWFNVLYGGLFLCYSMNNMNVSVWEELQLCLC